MAKGKFTLRLNKLRLNLKTFCKLSGIQYEAAREWNRVGKDIPLMVEFWLKDRETLILFSKDILKNHNILKSRSSRLELCSCKSCIKARNILYPSTVNL